MDEHDHTARDTVEVDAPDEPLESELTESDAAASDSGDDAPPPDPDAYGETVRLATQLVRGTRLERARLAARELDRSTAAERAASVDVAGLDASTGDPATLSQRLHALARGGDADLAERIRLLAGFDEAGLRRQDGCRTCVQWMGMYLGIAESSAHERLHVGRKLPKLPWITRLFRVGELSWSQVLRLSRVATPDTERTLAAAALDLTIKGLDALCREYRHADSPGEDDDDAAAWTAWRERSADFRRIDEHTTELRVRLPHDMAANFRGALEHGLEVLRDGGAADHPEADESLPGPPDAGAPDTGAPATDGAASIPPRPSVCGCGDAEHGAGTGAATDAAAGDAPGTGRDAASCALSARRAVISGFGPVAPAVALRIACHAGLTSIATDEHGDVLGVGRSRRTLPVALSRALAVRDPVCRVPGCRSTHRLEEHHLDHWGRGGDSALARMTRVCHPCHHWLHEGGYTLGRMRADDVVLSARAEALPGTEAERRAARALIATVARYRLLDRDGRTVRESRSTRTVQWRRWP